MRESTRCLVELYRRGIYTELELFDKQKQAIEKLESEDIIEVLYGGGARGGKSWFGCTWQLFRRLSMPNSFGLIGREEFSKLRDTTLLTFFKVCAWYGVKQGIDFNYNAQTARVEFYNGSIIFFREIKYMPSDPEFDRLGSFDLTDVFLDEAQQIKAKARSVLRGRLSVLAGANWQTTPKMFYSCNPALNWIKTDFVIPQKENRLSKDKIFIPSLATDNPFVDQSYIDNLKKADKVTRERLLYGNFDYDDDPSRLLEYDEITDLFTNPVEPNNDDKYISCDVARMGKDKTVIGLWKGLVCYIRSKNVDNKTRVNETVAMLKDLEKSEEVRRSKQIIDEDGVGGGVVDFHAGCLGFVNNSSPLEVEVEKDGYFVKEKPNFANLKTQCAFLFADYAKAGKIKIVCDETTRELIIEEISQLKRKNLDKDDQKIKLVSKDEIKENIGRSPDFLDMIIMRMYFELKETTDENLVVFI